MRMTVRVLGMLTALAATLLLLAFVVFAQGFPWPQPSYVGTSGPIDVDGVIGMDEWDLEGDFFADLWKGGIVGEGRHMGSVYLRYNCKTLTLYALVRLDEGISIDPSSPNEDHFIKIGQLTVLVDAGDHNEQPDDKTPPDFEWVYLDTAKVGWEASTFLQPGDYDNLNIHTQVETDETAAFTGRAIGVSLVCWEFGDLPDDDTEGVLPGYNNYNVTRLDPDRQWDGGRHRIGDVWLGELIDGEVDGNGSATSVGDDEDDVDDEDGVQPIWPWILGPDGGTLQVTVSGGDGLLYGWIDWCNDANLVTPGDQIFSGLLLSEGAHTLKFTIATTCTVDLSNAVLYTRFRLYEPPAGGTFAAAASLMADGDSYAVTGAAYNGEVEDYVWNTSPTGVRLGSFSVTAQTGALRATWETASEVDSLGFNVYRAESPNGLRILLNDSLISSQTPGSATGATYEFVDEAVEPGVDYYYWLEIVDVNGHGTEYGPVIGSPLVPMGPYRILLPFVIR